MRVLIIATASLLAGCATTSGADLRAQRDAEIFTSTKAPAVVAKCLADTVEVHGTPVVTSADGETSVAFMIDGNAMLTFDIAPTDAGSRIEARKAFAIMPGIKQAQACF